MLISYRKEQHNIFWNNATLINPKHAKLELILTLYPIETHFDAFAKRARSTLFSYGNMIKYDPTLVDF